MPRIRQEQFELRLPVIDLKCDAAAADLADNIPPTLYCNRLSTPDLTLRCIDGVLGSLTVDMSLRRFETESSQTCVTRSAPPYYKLTSGITRHTFFRNP